MKKYLIALIAGIAVSFGFMSFGYIAVANPSHFMRQNTGITITATSSIAYMSPGAATTTYYFDAGQASAGSADSAIFAGQFTGSSTASNVNIALEYAQGGSGDCIGTPTICDWYTDRLTAGATTTQTVNLDVPTSYRIDMASTSGNGLAAIASRTFRVFDVKTPTRYVRAVITMPAGSQNGAFWGEFIAKRQAN